MWVIGLQELSSGCNVVQEDSILFGCLITVEEVGKYINSLSSNKVLVLFTDRLVAYAVFQILDHRWNVHFIRSEG